MNEQLVALHDLIHKQLAPSQLKTANHAKVCKQALANAAQLQESFIQAAILHYNHDELMQLVRSAQYAAAVFLETLHTYHNQQPHPVYVQLRDILCRFVWLLLCKHPRYFDFNVPMPLAMWRPWQKQTDQLLQELYGKMSTELVTFIAEEYEPLLLNKKTPTFFTALYWNGLAQKLNNMPKQSLRDNHHRDTLIANNFNTPAFIGYMKNFYQNEVYMHANATHGWAGHLEHITAIPEITVAGLYVTYATCKQQLLDYLYTQQHNCFEKQTDSTGTPATDEPLLLTISISQLGLFLRLLVETNWFDVSVTHADVIRQFIKICSTPRASNISYNYLHQKFYDVDPIAKKIVEQRLLHMLQLLRTQ